jgi:cell division protein FtsW (lipid II flippase)
VPVFIFFVAAIFGLAAINGRVKQLFDQGRKDLFGDGQSYGFILWAVAILVVASVFKAIDLGDAGKVFVALLIIAFLLGTPRRRQQPRTAIEGGCTGAGGFVRFIDDSARDYNAKSIERRWRRWQCFEQHTGRWHFTQPGVCDVGAGSKQGKLKDERWKGLR